MPIDILYGDLADFKVDVEELRKYYESTVLPSPPVNYRHGVENYQGWALTSRDGSTDDGVRMNRSGPPLTNAVTPTPLCTGVMRDTLEKIESLGLKFFRARIFRLADQGYSMGFHIDTKREAWRLHIPIITSPSSLFEWELTNGEIVSLHLPADGRAWFVRVDQRHRAINTSEGAGDRVHIILSIWSRPDRQLFGADSYVLPPDLHRGPGRRKRDAPPESEQMGRSTA